MKSTYYIRIRTMDVANQIVLFLHGGCGSPDRGQVMKYQSALADKFTIVAWDQRGAGLAYNKKETKSLTLTKEIYVEDAHNVVCYLKKRFNKDKIIIVGHSFGSVLGIWLAQVYPQDIEAYIGVGQCIDYVQNEQLSYAWAFDEAKRVNDKKSIRVLQKIGFPTNGKYEGNHLKCLMKQRAVLHKLGGATFANRKPYWKELLFHDIPIMRTEYKLRQLIPYLKGVNYTQNSPLGNTNPDFMNNARSLEVPVYLLLGRYDYNCPSLLAEKWLAMLQAPDKRLIWFENSAHSPQWEESELWNERFRKLFE